VNVEVTLDLRPVATSIAVCPIDVGETAMRFRTELALVLFSVGSTAQAASSGGRYSTRPLTLGQQTLRFDLAPPDFALLDSGEINEGRGIAFTRASNGQTYFGLGAGLSYGVTDDVELGALVLPLLLHPEVRYGDAELYGRFRLVSGGFELALQAGGQLPTHTYGGFAFGMPMLVRAGTSARIDFGPELELMLPRRDTYANLDVPFAVHWDLGEGGFFGLRTGVFVPRFEGRGTSIKFGIQGGPILADGDLDLVFWFLFPELFHPAVRHGWFVADHFQIGVGISVRFGT
jgi:hypothetical protein